MFSSVGWGEILILIAAGLIILGPERLPGAVSWTMQSIRKARDYATGTTEQLKNELGPEFDELRVPLSQLNELRGTTPTALITKHLLDGDDSLFTGGLDTHTVDRSQTQTPPIKPVSRSVPTGSGETARDLPADEPATGADTPGEPRAGRTHDVTDWDAT